MKQGPPQYGMIPQDMSQNQLLSQTTQKKMILENTMTSSSQLATGGPRNKTPDNYNNKGKMMIVSQ